MIKKKSGGRIYGVIFTKSEQKSIRTELQKQLAEYDRKHETELQALILWELHTQLGFGAKRLRRFYDAFDKAVKDLIGRYDLEDSDQVWLCTHKLKEIGIDLEKWNKERTD